MADTVGTFNPVEHFDARDMTDQEALEYMQTKPAYQKGVLAALEQAKASTSINRDALIATHERQLAAELEKVKDRNLKVVDKDTGKETVIEVKSVSTPQGSVFDKNAALNSYVASKAVEKFTEVEANRILADSTAVNEAGEKVAETPEQKAALANLAVKLIQFGGRDVNAKQKTDLLAKAMPDSGQQEIFNLANSIRPAVSVSKDGTPYTSYGSNLTIGIVQENTNVGPRFKARVVSPEGVRLGDTNFNPTDMLTLGLSPQVMLDGINKLEAAIARTGSRQTLPGNANILRDALQNNLSGTDFMMSLQEQAARPGGGTSQSGDREPVTFSVEKPYEYRDFMYGVPGLDDTSRQLAEKDIDRRLTGIEVYSLVQDAGFTAPAHSIPSYLQTLNKMFNTPNNNITFGSGGLQYEFSDGSAVVWGNRPENLNLLAYEIGLDTTNIPYTGQSFQQAKNFNSREEWENWMQSQEQVAPQTVATQQPTVKEPTVAEPLTQRGATTTPPTTDQRPPTPTLPTLPPTYGTQQLPQQPTTPQPGFTPPTNIFGTQTGSQTAGLSAIPQTVTPAPAGQAGFTPQQLTTTMPGMGGAPAGVRTVNYANQYGQSIPVTEMNGQPITYVPPGYSRTAGAAEGGLMVKGYQEGGSVDDSELDAMYRMATRFLGYRGPRSRAALENFAKSSPAAASKMRAYTTAMAKGGMVRKGYSNGGLETGNWSVVQNPNPQPGDNNWFVYDPQGNLLYGSPTQEAAQNYMTQASSQANPPTVGASNLYGMNQQQQTQTAQQAGPTYNLQTSAVPLLSQTMQPIQAPFAMIQPTVEDFIPTTAGQAAPLAPFAESAATPTTAQAGAPFMTPASFMQAATAAPQVQAETGQLQAAQGMVSPQAQVQAAQQATTSVTDLQAAQGTAYLMQNPVQREIQQGELITGAADAQKAAVFTEQIQAATATPSKQATVQGQLETLMAQFDDGNRPAWAAGSMRAAMATLAARGLSASSLAGQAVIQAAMESALPIAQMDAQVQAQFESQNLSNRQQRAMLAAQQRAEFLGMEFNQEFQARVQNSARIGDIANMNFTAEQQVALENSRAANTMNLQNLTNRQAMVMAEAAALANLDMANLNNRQQAAVQNAQNFLQMDLTNLNNEQQTGLFRSQQNIQALFTDQAAQNAALQFNVASENQTNQFFSSLNAQVSQFNATQRNAMDQFNVNSVNAMRQFNSEVQQQRDLFNAQNGLVIAQANAQWRQNIATLNNATQNQSNMEFARTINALTSTNLDQIWQRERDIMSYAFTQSESAMDRALNILLADKELDAYREKMAADESNARAAFGTSVLLEWMK